VAARLARRHGVRLYSSDTRTWAHRNRALAHGSEAARRWEALAPDARWEGPDDELLALSLHRERGPMVVDDLRALPSSPLVIAEGSVLPAAAVADRSRAVWLIPAPAFQRERLAAGGRTGGRARLDAHLRDVIAREADTHGVPVLPVDESSSADAVLAAVQRRFAAALAAGPRAATSAERRALLREANLAIVAQVRGYHARPWARGDAEAVVAAFACECGDPRCTVDLRLTVAAAAAGPALAPGHAGQPT
jgi:hypothetical protein